MNTATAIRTISTEAGAVLQNTCNGAAFSTNAVGARIWKDLAKGLPADEIVNRISSEFGVEREQVCKDVAEFLQRLKQAGLLQQESSHAK
jgi:hypothetical protein